MSSEHYTSMTGVTNQLAHERMMKGTANNNEPHSISTSGQHEYTETEELYMNTLTVRD